MLLIRDIRLRPGESEARLPLLAAKALGLAPERVKSWRIVKKSLDARRKGDIHWTYSLAVEAAGDAGALLRRCPQAERREPYRYEIPRVRVLPETRPVIAGFGPGGMFAALVLAEAGLRPIVLERGGDADTRKAAVERFWQTGELTENCSVQFGEGGAGTFSDGKLATNTHDPRNAWVLERLRDFGAGESVVYDARPHVGTDVLAGVVKNLRRHVESLGGEVRFFTRMTGFERRGNALSAVLAEGPAGLERLACRELVLATGHSARDVFELLLREGVPLEAKPFSMGVRIEHRQTWIDRAQYGRDRGPLPPAEYRLNVRLPGGGSAYTFCMCPGGYVVAAASEAEGVVTNGMSYSGRAGENANAALLVTLAPSDFPGNGGPLDGMYWQREIERACYAYGGGNCFAPAQTVGDFLAGRKSRRGGAVAPSYRPGVVWGELREVLPEPISGVLAASLPLLGRKLRGFDHPEAVLTAPETRSSSPVRILRDGSMQSALRGLYPCGEGAGYAGGITSAAADGMRCAEAVLKGYAEIDKVIKVREEITVRYGEQLGSL